MVHLFERMGLQLALDVGSGAVHLLDDTAASLLETLPEARLREPLDPQTPAVAALAARYGNKALEETRRELAALMEQGLLFADDGYEEFAGELGLAPVKAMCLHIAHDCNLRCRYCFASTGGFGGSRKLMSLETAKSAMDLLVRLSEGRTNLEVDFFGGEPLMNFEVVQQTVAYARSLEERHGKRFRFTITTNGLLLNEDNTRYINREMNNVVLSIDGRAAVHDAMRPRADGSGSYNAILPKLRRLVNTRGGKEYYVRGTYTRENLDFDADVLDLARQGFRQISVEPVVGSAEEPYAIREEDLAKIEQSYERLLNEMARRRTGGRGDFNFFHFMVDLDNGPCAIKRLKGCGSGNEYVAVTPEGELYPCHQFVGQREFVMGNVQDGVLNGALKEQFAQANLLNKPDCQRCWAKLFCSGGCAANNYTFEGSLLRPHKLSCELEKVRLECAIALQAAGLMETKAGGAERTAQQAGAEPLEMG